MNLPPICANPVSCVDSNCLRRHAFYLTAEERIEVKNCIDYHWKECKLFNHKYEFPKKPNWCYDGHFCLNNKCYYDHILDFKGRNIICNICRDEIEDILIPIPE